MSIFPSIYSSSEGSTDLPGIPTQVISMDEQVIALIGDVWSARVSPDGGKYKHFNWNLIDAPKNESIFTYRAIHIMKLYVADMISKRKVATARAYYSAFLYRADLTSLQLELKKRYSLEPSDDELFEQPN